MNRRGSVNWQDGMLIEASHFAAETEYLRELIGRSRRMAHPWFGVYAEPGDSSLPLDLSLAVDGLECTVELRRFRGVFRDGLWVDFEAESRDVVVARRMLEGSGDQSIPIHLSVTTDDYLEFGEPDPVADPPRQPYRQPLLRLELGPGAGASANRSMVLGGLIVHDGVARLDTSRVPPCATMASWPAMRDLADRFTKRLHLWREVAVGHFKLLAPIATAATGGTGREVDYAKRETAFQWAMEVSRLQSLQTLVAQTGTPRRWFASVQTLARGLRTLLDLNPILSRDVSVREEGSLIALRGAIAHVPDANDLSSMGLVAEATMEAVDRVLEAIYGATAKSDDTLVYRGKTYRLATYARRSYRREPNMSYLEITGISVPNVEDAVIYTQGEIGKLLSSGRIGGPRIGPNDRVAFPMAEPAEFDATSEAPALLVHPIAFRGVAELNRLTLMCPGAENLSGFERGADDEVRLFLLSKSAP